MASVPALAAAVGHITLEDEGGTRVLRLVGEIDDAAIIAYEEALATPDHSLTTNPISVVDMAAVTFFSSAGVGFLLRHTRAARERGQRPALRGLTNPARRILHITGITALFDPAA
jgi:anti-anti-sigma factor